MIPAGIAMGASVKATVDFDKGMRNVNSIAQLSEKQLRKLSGSVLDLAGPTAQSPKVLSEGLYDLVSSGFDARESMQILNKSARAATAGLTSTEVATGAVAAVLNAYRKPAKAAGDVSDVLFRTVDRGVITFEELASTVGDVLPFASSLGVDLREVGASVATMTKAGISAPETMTRIKNVMVSMLKPGEGLKQAFADLGVESGEALIKQKGFQGALEALIGTTDGSKAAVAKLFPNIRALGGALALTGNNAKAANQDLRGMEEASGATSKALAQQSQSVSFQWNRLKARAEELAIRVGSKLIPEMNDLLAILSDPKLSSEERFAKLFDKIGESAGRLVPQMLKAGVRAGGALAHGLVQGVAHQNVFVKLLTGAALIRLFGGKGALTAAGAGVGKWIGIGVSAGAASGMAGGAGAGAGGAGLGRGASRGGLLAGLVGASLGGFSGGGRMARVGERIGRTKIGAPLGRAIASSATASAAADFGPRVSGALSKIKWARVGGIGVGLMLADSIMQGVALRAEERGEDLMKAIQAKTKASAFGQPLPLNVKEGMLTKLTGWDPFGSGAAQKAKDLESALKNVQSAADGISRSDRRRVESLAKQVDLTKEQQDALRGILGGAEKLRQQVDLKFRGLDLTSDIRLSWSKGLRQMTGLTNKRLDEIRQLFRERPEQGRKAMASALDRGVKNVRKAMDAGTIATDKGLRMIEKLLRQKLAMFGVTGFAADRAMHIADAAAKGKDMSHQGLQTGGRVVPGSGTGDKVPAMLEPGEVVWNRKAVAAMGGPGIANSVNKMIPRFQKGGSVKMPRWAADYPAALPAAYSANTAAALAEKVLKKAAGGDLGSVGNIVALGRILTRAGYQVGEHPKFGGVSGVHVPGSFHYRGRALDVNHDQGGESAALDRIARPLRRNKNVKELLWRTAGHFDHLHVAMQGGGIVPRRPLRGSHWIKGGASRSPRGRLWNEDEAATLLWQVGASVAQAKLLSRKLMGESGGNPRAHGPPDGRGLFQIERQFHPELRSLNLWNPIQNAAAALHILKKQGIGAWYAPSGRAGNILRNMIGGSRRRGLPKKLAGKIGKLALPGSHGQKIRNLTHWADTYEEWATRAESLGSAVYGGTEVTWLQRALETLFELRNALIVAHNAIATRLQKAQALLKKTKNRKARAKIQSAIKTLKGQRGEFSDVLGDVQGLVPGHIRFKPLTSAEPGLLGGRIFDVQMRLREAGENATATSAKQALSAADLRNLTYLSGLGVKFNPSQFAGFFASGGDIPRGKFGIAGEAGLPEVVLGPSRVVPLTRAGATAGGNPNITLYADLYVGGELIEERVEMKLRSHERERDLAYRAGP